MKTIELERAEQAQAALGVYQGAFQRSLAAENRSPRTLQTYGEAVEQFGAFLAEKGMPTDPSAITREHVEEWIAHLLTNWKPATAKNRFRSLHRFFVYLEDVGEITAHPMRKMRAPAVDDVEIPVVSEGDLKKLLKTVEGKKTFRERRDAALIRIFLDTGLRVSEMVGLHHSAPKDGEAEAHSFLDRKEFVLYVLGKGRRHRRIPIGNKAAAALDRYLFVRAKHSHAENPMLWLGERGPMTVSGAYQALETRCAEAGVARIHPHQLRHTWAHISKSSDMADDDVKYLAGWRSDTMLARYGKSAQAERAMKAKRRFSPGDLV